MLRFENITKQFGISTVLHSVDFEIKSGEIHALLGENGSGKSTLLNILHGIYSDYQGRVIIEDELVQFKTPYDALRFGIAKVHQEVNVVSGLLAGENIALGYEIAKMGFINRKQMFKKTDELLDRLGCNFTSTARVEDLSAADLQMIQIAKALYHNARIISFDEPTASLSQRETDRLFDIIRDLKKQGKTILYVSHRMDEIFQICDRASVMRDGHYIGTYDVNKITKDELIRNMVGRDVSAYAKRHKPLRATEEVVLQVEHLTRPRVFEDISFELHRGEILGFSGLVGAKRTDVMMALFGADPYVSGTIKKNGKVIHNDSPSHSLKNGIALLPENRKAHGFIQDTTNKDNIAIASVKNFLKGGLFIDWRKAKENCIKYINLLQISPPDPEFITSSLSGGNQQKVILAKWMTADADIIIFDEPTKGIDVGAKAEIYAVMEDLVQHGKSIIMVSSELTEIIGMSDHVVVMNEGKMTAYLNRDQLTEELLLQYSMGG